MEMEKKFGLPEGVKSFSQQTVQPSVPTYGKWLLGWSQRDIPELTGKVALVTGGNSGIGFEMCRKLAENGAHVFLVSRVRENGERAAEQIRSEFKGMKGLGRIHVLACDLRDLDSVQKMVTEFKAKSSNKLHILVNNASMFIAGPYEETQQGFEQSLGVDYYSPVYLTTALLDTLVASAPSRIVFVSSEAERAGRVDFQNMRGKLFKDSGFAPYATAKLFLLMYAQELSEKLKGKGVDVFAVHPGLVNTPLVDKSSRSNLFAWGIWAQAKLFGLTPHQGATAPLYAATEPSLKGAGFKYFGPNTLNLFWTQEKRPKNSYFHKPNVRERVVLDTYTMLKHANFAPPQPTSVPGLVQYAF